MKVRGILNNDSTLKNACSNNDKMQRTWQNNLPFMFWAPVSLNILHILVFIKSLNKAIGMVHYKCFDYKIV